MKNNLFRAGGLLFFLLLLGLSAAAQQASAIDDGVAMADVLRQNGKIYVVVAVVVVIVAGLLAYLFALDRKVSRLEKDLNA